MFTHVFSAENYTKIHHEPMYGRLIIFNKIFLRYITQLLTHSISLKSVTAIFTSNTLMVTINQTPKLIHLTCTYPWKLFMIKTVQ